MTVSTVVGLVSACGRPSTGQMTDGAAVQARTTRDDQDDHVVEDGKAGAAAGEQEEGDAADPRMDVEVDGVEELSVPLTPDGGWGWMVVVASFVSNLIVDGVAYTFGIIMPQLIDHFDASKGKTAVVGSLIPGLYSIVGNRRA